MKLLRFGWLCWLIAAMLFFSGTKGTGWLILLFVIAGFGVSLAVASRTMRSNP